MYRWHKPISHRPLAPQCGWRVSRLRDRVHTTPDKMRNVCPYPLIRLINYTTEHRCLQRRRRGQGSPTRPTMGEMKPPPHIYRLSFHWNGQLQQFATGHVPAPHAAHPRVRPSRSPVASAQRGGTRRPIPGYQRRYQLLRGDGGVLHARWLQSFRRIVVK